MTVENLGAWLLKGNADRGDLVERFQHAPRVESWCVQPGYRARMMAPGQPVVFWGSGSRSGLTYGVWGCGVVAGPAGRGQLGDVVRVAADPQREPAVHRDAVVRVDGFDHGCRAGRHSRRVARPHPC